MRGIHLEEQEEAAGKLLPLEQNVAPGQVERQAGHEPRVWHILQGSKEVGTQTPLTATHDIPPVLQAGLQRSSTC